MTRFYLIGFTALLMVNIANGQTILKKRDVKLKLKIISYEIQLKNFENAMNLFYNKKEIIQKKNVPKKFLEQFNIIETTLSQKKTEFESNKDKVDIFKKQYDSKNYCSATGLLSLNLTNENSYKASREIKTKLTANLKEAKQKCESNKDKVDTFKKQYDSENYCSATGLLSLNLTNENSYKASREIKTKLTANLKEAKQKCESNSEKIIEWENSYKKMEYEKIYQLLEISNYEKKKFNSNDLNILGILQNNLKGKYLIYMSVKEKIISTPERIINRINFDSLTYEQSEQLIQEFTTILNYSNSEIQKLEGSNPILKDLFTNTKLKIDNKLTELYQFSKANKPLTKNEITQQVFSNKSISIDFILNKCLKADITVYHIFYLDVLAYYKINDYDTDLKKKVFKKSSEYQNHLKKLKSMRAEMLKSTYYVKLEGLFNETDYELKRKGFDITIGQNYGMGTIAAKPPKSVCVDGERSFIQLKSIPSKQVNFWEEGTKNEKLFVPVNETNGLEIEENKKNIDIYFLFTPSGQKTVKYKYNNFGFDFGGWYIITDKVITASKVRMIVVNRMTEKIYFDKIY